MIKPILTCLFLVALTYLLSALHAESFNLTTANSTIKWWFTFGVLAALAPTVFLIPSKPKPCCTKEEENSND